MEIGRYFGVGEEGIAFGVIAALFVAMLGCLELGRFLGARARGRGDAAGVATIDAALFALLGLLIAFTFSGAAGRFESRRELIRDEANAVGTAYLRIDLITPAAQPLLRQNFRDYVDARLAVYDNVTDPAATRAAVARVGGMQAELWRNAIAGATATQGVAASTVFLPAINQMFDMATTRMVAAQAHPPSIVFLMLGFLALACSLTAGFGMTGGNRSREWLHVLAFAASISLTLYVILDLEYPRIGLFTITGADQILIDVRDTMGPATAR
ncbi:MAG: hypothetical protein ACRCUI_09290 [Polymorphobacter sp.]